MALVSLLQHRIVRSLCFFLDATGSGASIRSTTQIRVISMFSQSPSRDCILAQLHPSRIFTLISFKVLFIFHLRLSLLIEKLLYFVPNIVLRKFLFCSLQPVFSVHDRKMEVSDNVLHFGAQWRSRRSSEFAYHNEVEVILCQ